MHASDCRGHAQGRWRVHPRREFKRVRVAWVNKRMPLGHTAGYKKRGYFVMMGRQAAAVVTGYW